MQEKTDTDATTGSKDHLTQITSVTSTTPSSTTTKPPLSKEGDLDSSTALASLPTTSNNSSSDDDDGGGDEALAFLTNHPRRREIFAEARAMLEDDATRAALVRKIDWNIAPLLCCVYFLQFLDKNTISYTSVMGMRQDTHMKGQQYNDISMLFYASYLVFEFPTQYLAQRLNRVSLYMGINIMLWGTVLACHAAATSFGALAVLRTLLGVFEACVPPLLVLIVAMWYRKEEQGRRISWFYVCNSVTKIFGGLVAYGISYVQGALATWRIFFLAIGLATVATGWAVAVWMPDSPVQARRFRDAEKVAVLLRIRDNQSGTQNKHLKKDQVREAFTDVRVWLICLSMMLIAIPNGGIANFNNILLTTFGYTPRQALLLDAPVGLLSGIFILTLGHLSDKLNDRSTISILCLLPTIAAGFLMFFLVDPQTGHPLSKPLLLLASLLSGSYNASFMVLLAWSASNIGGHSKKVTVNALALVCLSLGSMLGTQTFRASQKPIYQAGKLSIVVCLLADCVVLCVLRWCNARLNRRNEKVRRELGVVEGGVQERREVERVAWSDLGDRQNVFFRYTK
ncbi:MFS transporter [Phyllosticta capitalensis]|uniref:MFS transporter n=2 Tax=Phyllosticta capitalensis TaxID=121624 RepID=A0ABR1YB23_9PEZI